MKDNSDSQIKFSFAQITSDEARQTSLEMSLSISNLQLFVLCIYAILIAIVVDAKSLAFAAAGTACFVLIGTAAVQVRRLLNQIICFVYACSYEIVLKNLAYVAADLLVRALANCVQWLDPGLYLTFVSDFWLVLVL